MDTIFAMEIWHYLIIAAILSLLIEIFTTSFVFGAMGVGFLLSSIFSSCGASISWQIFVFSLGVVTTFFLIKPIISKFGYKKNGNLRTNAEGLVGKEGIVTQKIIPNENSGKVKLDGVNWSAISSKNDIIDVGMNVKIVEIKSIVLIVEPLK